MLPDRVWAATYFDGHTAARYDVHVRAGPDGLEISGGVGPLLWRYDAIRETPGLQATDPVRLERGGELPEVLVIEDSFILEAIRAHAPANLKRFSRRRTGFFSSRRAIAAVAALVVVPIIAYVWAIPYFADRVAKRVPVSWEENVGRSLNTAFASTTLACDNPAGVAALDRIVQRLAADGRGGPYTYRVRIVDDSLVNALAWPGGYIVVFRGLIDKAESAEEVAGVLAHEMQHVVLRHSTRGILRAVPFQLVRSLIGQSIAIDVFTVIGTHRYGRADELAADREGMKTLQDARISQTGVIAFFEKLQAEEARDGPATPVYLSTHPSTEARIAALKATVEGAAYAAEPALTADEWAALKGSCRRR